MRVVAEASGDHSVTETALCGPNFIIMTQSYQHTPPDKSTAELRWRADQSGPAGHQRRVTPADGGSSHSTLPLTYSAKMEMHVSVKMGKKPQAQLN